MNTIDTIEAILSNAKYLDSHRDECAKILSQGELLEVCADLSYLVKVIKKHSNN